MKTKGSELGNLASRFLSYVQMRKLQVIRTGEIEPVLDISAGQERDLFRRLSSSGWILRLKRGVYLAPPRIPAGGKYSPGQALILQKLMDEVKGTYQICGPTAFNFYGLDDQIPNVTYLYNNRISGKRSIGSLAFQFIKVADKRLGSIKNVRTREGVEIIYSSKARTLIDAVYDWSRFNSLPKGYEWIKKELKSEPRLAAEIAEAAACYGNMATIRRIGFLLDASMKKQEIIDPLLRRLSKSSALIPWIPGRPSKGKAERKWGVIVNG